jgi:glyoxylase-like metal-dependent hydrolase (beta-lactamase superfamily II)
MHGDHIGGLLDADGKKIFKNAKVFVSKDERDYWLLNISARAANAALAKKVIDTYGKQFALLEWDKNNIVNEIKALTAIGHTPGHTIFEIVSEGKKILIVGDLVHLTIIQFADPNLSVSFDIDPAQAAKTRKEVLQYAYDNKMEIAGMHIPFSGVGTVLKDKAPRLYRFQPEK